MATRAGVIATVFKVGVSLLTKFYNVTFGVLPHTNSTHIWLFLNLSLACFFNLAFQVPINQSLNKRTLSDSTAFKSQNSF